MVRDRTWGIWGELKQWRQIENERFGCPSQVLYFARVLELFCCTSFLLGLHSQQISVFSDNVFCFVGFQSELTQKTLKFIISPKTWIRTSLDDDQADLFASLLLSTQPPSLWPTKKRQPNTRRWMLEKNSNELPDFSFKSRIDQGKKLKHIEAENICSEKFLSLFSCFLCLSAAPTDCCFSD